MRFVPAAVFCPIMLALLGCASEAPVTAVTATTICELSETDLVSGMTSRSIPFRRLDDAEFQAFVAWSHGGNSEATPVPADSAYQTPSPDLTDPPGALAVALISEHCVFGFLHPFGARELDGILHGARKHGGLGA